MVKLLLKRSSTSLTHLIWFGSDKEFRWLLKLHLVAYKWCHSCTRDNSSWIYKGLKRKELGQCERDSQVKKFVTSVESHIKKK